MASAFARIKTLVQVAADTGTDLIHQWLLGSSANPPVRYPDAWYKGSELRTRGSMWDSIAIPALLAEVGTELDTHGICWAHIDTNGTGVAPSVVAGSQVTSVAKDEVNNDLTMNFSINYTGSDNFVCVSFLDTVLSHQKMVARAVGSVTLSYWSEPGALRLDANNRTISFIAIGLR